MQSGTAEIGLSGRGVGAVAAPPRTSVVPRSKLRQSWYWLWRSLVAMALVAGMGALLLTASDGFVGDDFTAQEVANITLARRIVLAEILTYGNAEPISDVVAPGAVITMPGETWVGPEGMQQLVDWLDMHVPDRMIVLDSVEVLGDRVIMDGRITGSLPSGFLGAVARGEYGAIETVFTMTVFDHQLTSLRIDPAVM